jgi:uncharacterized membrane protein YkvI
MRDLIGVALVHCFNLRTQVSNVIIVLLLLMMLLLQHLFRQLVNDGSLMMNLLILTLMLPQQTVNLRQQIRRRCFFRGKFLRKTARLINSSLVLQF